jgi:hypothetical protein
MKWIKQDLQKVQKAWGLHEYGIQRDWNKVLKGRYERRGVIEKNKEEDKVSKSRCRFLEQWDKD